MSRGDDTLILRVVEKLPPKWQAVIVLVIIFGLPSAVCGYYMAQSAGWIPSIASDNKVILTRVENTLNQALTSMKAEVTTSHRNDEYVINLLLANCLNAAKDQIGIQRCQDYWIRSREAKP